MSGGGPGEAPRRAGVDAESGRAAPYEPIASGALAAVLALAFAAQWWAGALGADGSGYAVHLVGGLVASSVREGEIFRIVTAPLLHLHVHHFVLNFAGLLGFGSVVEAQVGHGRSLLIAMLSLLSGSIAAVSLPPAGGVVVGASGALFGMIGAMWMLALRTWRSAPPVLRRGRWIPVVVLAVDAALALLAPERVAWISHLGGFCGGMAVMAVLSRGERRLPLQRSSRRVRLTAAGLAALFLCGALVDLQRVASGRVCEVLERTDLSEAVREGFTAALSDLPVDCAGSESAEELL